jgi:hypothetical protein
MQHRRIATTLAATITLAFTAGSALGQTVRTKLEGYQEVPAVSSPGSGEFKAKIDKDAGTIYYELEYSGLQGTVVMSHIHVGQSGVNGGISVWLCQSATNPAPAAVAASVPTCPATGGNVNGMLMASSVIGPGAQLIAAGEFDELVAALRAGVTYVNVHTTAVPAGEIRGQIGGPGRRGGGHHHHHHD